MIHFAGLAGIGVLVAVAALVAPDKYVPYSGCLFFLNAVWAWTLGARLGKRARLASEPPNAAATSTAAS
jgi:hypothetical protein